MRSGSRGRAALARVARRLAWTGLYVRYDDVRDRLTVMARTVVYLYGAGACLVLASAPLTAGRGANIAVIVAIAATALVAAVVHLLLFDRVPVAGFQASGFFATGLVTTGIVFSGELASAFALFYFWVVLYAFFFYGLRAAGLQLAGIAGSYASLLFVPGVPLGAADVVVLLATLTVAGLIVLFVKNSLLRVVDSLLVSEARVRELFENADDLAYTLDLEARFTSVNRALERLTGYTRDELIGRPMVELVPPELVPFGLEQFRSKLERPQLVTRYECALVAKGGEEILVEIVSRVIASPDGRPLGVQGIARDVRERKRFERELAAAEQRYRALIEHLPLVTYVETADERRTLYVSPQLEALLGYTPDEWMSDPGLPAGLVHPEDRERVLDVRRVDGAPRSSHRLEYRLRARNGAFVWVRDEGHRVDGGGTSLVEGYLVDVTAEKEAEAALRASEERFRSLVQNASDVISVVDAETTVRYQTPGVAGVLGYAPEEMVGRKLLELVHPSDRRAFASLCRETAARPGEGARGEVRFRCSDGGWRYLDVVTRNELADPAIAGIVVTGHDLTERKQLERQLTEQAFRDALTSLPNRALFTDRLELALERSRRAGTRIAVLFLDLDDFKAVNDSFGHVVGDGLLVETGQRLRGCIRRPDTTARFGGDEFAILLETLGDRDVASVAERVLAAFDEPFRLEGLEVVVRPSIGIAIAGGSEAIDANEVLRNADVAMYRAKQDGARYAVFQPEMHRSVLRRLDLKRRLQSSLERDEFEVHYQRIVSVESGRLAGVEALARWLDPSQGLVEPTEFVPLAEHSGLIVALGDFVLRTASRQAREWQDEYGAGRFPVRINLSAQQLRDPEVVDKVAAALAETGLEPGGLMIEITESVLMPDVDETIARLEALRGLGVGLALDDFGTGYSSLAYLKRLPLQELKVDKAFVLNMHANAQDAAIVRSTVELARNLGLRVLAEGVESEAIWREVRAAGFDLGQGYFLGRPVPAADLDAALGFAGEIVAA